MRRLLAVSVLVIALAFPASVLATPKKIHCYREGPRPAPCVPWGEP